MKKRENEETLDKAQTHHLCKIYKCNHITIFSLMITSRMSFQELVKLNESAQIGSEEVFCMDINNMSTEEFVKKMNEDQKKQEKNKQHQGLGDPANNLPGKHGNN